MEEVLSVPIRTQPGVSLAMGNS